MESELISSGNYQIVIKNAPEVEFLGYEQLKTSAIKLSEHVKQFMVTTENVKESKKLITEINKENKRINDARIQLKKDLLKPYDDIEQKVKEIDTIIKEANENVKSQISELDQIEREEKKQLITEIFDKRIKNYKFNAIFSIADFLQPHHLNKSTSINKVEDEIVAWLEQTKNDFEVIRAMQHSEEILSEYTFVKNLSLSIQTVMDRHKRIEESKKAIDQAKSKKETKNETKYVTFAIREDQSKFVELLLKENNIEFKINN